MKAKTIKNGAQIERVAQACDRCRAKKTKCDGKNPCSSCSSVGLECIVSDKLTRRAYPKGYTETLEERVRSLEMENKRLSSLLDARAELSQVHSERLADLTVANLSLTHTDDTECPCGCDTAVHERPVSIAGSVYDNAVEVVKIEKERDYKNDNINHYTAPDEVVPGAFAAATVIAQMEKNRLFQQQQHLLDSGNQQQQLTQLVAISIPRTTEETLSIPTTLAKICQVYGYNSRTAIITANAMASLKEEKAEPDSSLLNLHVVLPLIGTDHFISQLLLPKARIDLDHLVTVYFQDWGNVLPVLDKQVFLQNYVRVAEHDFSMPQSHSVAAQLVLVLALALISCRSQYLKDPYYESLLAYYDRLIHALIANTSQCSVSSLQTLSLCLQYCLAVGDTSTCYVLRGRVVTMAQQLRLHRCPAAVLGISGMGTDVSVRNHMQGERRILFWCVYCLDVYSSLNLGVPRLLKEVEIECALPFSGKNDDDTDNVNILVVNNTRLSIVGKVTKLALAFMLYCKVLGCVLDTIFSRENADAHDQSVVTDQMLELWRRDLPPDFRSDSEHWAKLSKPQLFLVFLYHHAKLLMYMPVVSKHGNHHDVALSFKEQASRGSVTHHDIVSSVSTIQSSSLKILQLLRSLSSQSYLLPIPINMVRHQARLALLVAKGSLDYIKGGTLFQQSKDLLLGTRDIIQAESAWAVPNNISSSSARLTDLAIMSILGILKKKKVKVEDDIDSLLKFDPFEINLRDDFANEFAADGSLGLVPFLDEVWDTLELSHTRTLA